MLYTTRFVEKLKKIIIILHDYYMNKHTTYVRFHLYKKHAKGALKFLLLTLGTIVKWLLLI